MSVVVFVSGGLVSDGGLGGRSLWLREGGGRQ